MESSYLNFRTFNKKVVHKITFLQSWWECTWMKMECWETCSDSVAVWERWEKPQLRIFEPWRQNTKRRPQRARTSRREISFSCGQSSLAQLQREMLKSLFLLFVSGLVCCSTSTSGEAQNGKQELELEHQQQQQALSVILRLLTFLSFFTCPFFFIYERIFSLKITENMVKLKFASPN